MQKSKRLLLFAAWCFVSCCQPDASINHGKWISLSPRSDQTISGIAAYMDDFIVVHDNKVDGEPRFSTINRSKKRMSLSTIPTQPDSPFDLEAISPIPGKMNEYITMESTGKCYHVRLDEDAVIILDTFTLPVDIDVYNLEGFAIFAFNGLQFIVWGDRGSIDRPGRMSWGTIDFHPIKISFLDSYAFTVPYPNTETRHISDIAIDSTFTCWVSSTMDPGDKGPFNSAIYRLGHFGMEQNHLYFQPLENLMPVKTRDHHKIEAITLKGNRLIIATDNESAGATYTEVEVK